ncbi:L,D-transpeptidase [Mangrovimonas xylaniphaga]|uniref:L,D-transpeptidase n=1 Tax=Mangrovimonas xylaniphaga TaxID=1645915 RepID=UPI0006B5BD55|nr:L,D-transpeptidase [Mangrovimonas xylaniphaga]
MSYKLLAIFILGILLKSSLFQEKNFFLSQFNTQQDTISTEKAWRTIKIDRNITIENYFQYVDSLVKQYDSLTKYPLTEHLLIRANPWVIDTLYNTDYYLMKARDSFIYDQKKMIALPKGNTLKVPDSLTAKGLLTAFQNTRIDVNIPEFKLRIYEGESELYEFPVRVGRHETKYLKMSDKIEDLRTKTGEGHIVAHNKHPRYVNPATNHEYFVTRRDDNKVTKLPLIPFTETELDGQKYGQMIHPTTNPVTLGKAYSNGCIGTRESDAWIVYYYTPIGTQIQVRYDLKVVNKEGDTLILKDIYKKGD